MKQHTDLHQSRTLAEILPHDTADQTYKRVVIASHSFIPDEKQYTHYGDMPFRHYSGIGIPCWSLAALLDYLKSKNKFPEIKELSDGRFKLTTYIWDGEDCIQVSIGDTIVDACYEMILKLHELKLI